MHYNKECLQEDENWLREQGVCTEEVRMFLIQTITSGFQMTRKEFAEFISEVKK